MKKILQITDLHMRCALPGHNGHLERLGRHIPGLLSRLASRIAEEDPDLVVITGDLVDSPAALLHGTARDPDLDALRAAAIADYRQLAAWLEGLERPWMVLPGNHDFDPAFQAVFADRPKQMALEDIVVHAFHDWEQARNQAERLGEERRRFLDLLEAGDDTTREVHLQHYVIHPRIDYSYPLLYKEADELTAAIASAPGRRLVISGHWHGGAPLVERGNAAFTVCPAFCEAPHPYRVYEIGARAKVVMRQEHLGRSIGSDRLIIVDRGGILTSSIEPGAFALREDAGRTMRALQAVAPVALASGWFEDESATTKWREIQALNDRFFAELGTGEAQGAALAIYMREQDRSRFSLPAEEVATEDSLFARLMNLFGTPAEDVTFLTTDAGRRAIAVSAGVVSPVLSAAPTQEEIVAAADAA